MMPTFHFIRFISVDDAKEIGFTDAELALLYATRPPGIYPCISFDPNINAKDYRWFEVDMINTIQDIRVKNPDMSFEAIVAMYKLCGEDLK